MTVEALLRFWGEDAAVRALRRRTLAPIRRERLERFLEARGWPWIGVVSLLIDRTVVDEESMA